MTAGTIALPCDELARFSAFMVATWGLDRPPGTFLCAMHGRNITKNCNKIVRNMRGDWIWWQADDHVFEPDLLVRLLRRNVDVVAPVMLMRQHPFLPVAYKGEHADGQHIPLDFTDLPDSGMVDVYAVGGGGMLVRKRVFDAISDPWFENIQVGENGEHTLGEDLSFCRKVREAGFKIHLDLEAKMGHLSTMAVWPKHTETDGWVVHVDFNSGAK